MKRTKPSAGNERTAEKRGAFDRFARAAARTAGHPLAFGLAIAAVLLWAVLGPVFGFSDTWQLIINTATTVVTFFMVFVIQNTQNRDSEAMQLKLDELIRALRPAHNALLDIEELSEQELDEIKAEFQKLARKARQASRATASVETGSEADSGNKTAPSNGQAKDRQRPRLNGSNAKPGTPRDSGAKERG